MQFIVGIATALILAFALGITIGWGLLPMLIAFGKAQPLCAFAPLREQILSQPITIPPGNRDWL